jgi:hypothetical protein
VSDGQPAGQDRQQSGKFRIDFIDPLFAVAIHIGFVEGLLTESWAHDRTFPAFNDIANIWMFFVGLFFVIVTSWVGYHLSIERRPLKQNERFYIDIVLLVLYFFVLLYFRSPSKMCVLLVLIYVFYIAWDYYKTREYDQEFYGGGPPPTGIGYLRLCARGWFRRNSAPALIGEVVTFGWLTCYARSHKRLAHCSALNESLRWDVYHVARMTILFSAQTGQALFSR